MSVAVIIILNLVTLILVGVVVYDRFRTMPNDDDDDDEPSLFKSIAATLRSFAMT